MSAAVTMKTIAGQAGVTPATVSLSLANHPRIPAETRVRIQAIARQLGYRRPGLVLRRLHQMRFQGRWEAGFLVAAEMLSGLERVPPLYLENWDRPAPLLAWLRRERPDVIITPAAPAVLGPLKRAGLRVPADIGLALLACPRLGDPVSGVYQNGRLVGALAVDTLISLAERHEYGLPAQATTLMVEGRWYEGRTLRAAAPAA